MIGDKYLFIPRTKEEVSKIYDEIGLKHYSFDEIQCKTLEEYICYNACKLVEINNELYDKFKNPTWLREKLNSL
jgi:hypothetical protein